MTIAAQSGLGPAETCNVGRIRTSRPATRPTGSGSDGIPVGLTRDEDDELRRLNWLSQIGTLAARKVERLIELRLRDRRSEIRPPREFEQKRDGATPGDPDPPGASAPSATSEVGESGLADLARVRRHLESMAQSRLLTPFDEEQRQRYQRLLELEKALLDPLPSAEGSAGAVDRSSD
jgi:hypothetical protein